MPVLNFFYILFPTTHLSRIIEFLKFVFFIKKQSKTLKLQNDLSINNFKKAYLEVMSFHFSLNSIFLNFFYFKFFDKFFLYALFSFDSSATYLNSNTRLKYRLAQSDLGIYNFLSSAANFSNNSFISTYFLVGLKSL